MTRKARKALKNELVALKLELDILLLELRAEEAFEQWAKTHSNPIVNRLRGVV